jgi:UDPglucose 6-dehydrogenase
MAERQTIGIVGNGYVGSAIAAAFAHTTYVKVYDTNPIRSSNTLEELCIESEYIFVCVPTPSSSDGSQDLSYIRSALREIAKCCKEVDSDPLVIIKSTVVPGTTKNLAEETGLEIVFSPEFLTARTAMQDFANPDRIIFGCRHSRIGCELTRLFQERFPAANYIITSRSEAEFIKYMVNTFFATKLIFMNAMRGFASERRYNWNSCIEGFASDHRIANSHIEVPGHDKRPGFGGACLPKDLKALSKVFEEDGLDNSLLDTIIKINDGYRKDN